MAEKHFRLFTDDGHNTPGAIYFCDETTMQRIVEFLNTSSHVPLVYDDFEPPADWDASQVVGEDAINEDEDFQEWRKEHEREISVEWEIDNAEMDMGEDAAGEETFITTKLHGLSDMEVLERLRRLPLFGIAGSLEAGLLKGDADLIDEVERGMHCNVVEFSEDRSAYLTETEIVVWARFAPLNEQPGGRVEVRVDRKRA